MLKLQSFDMSTAEILQEIAIPPKPHLEDLVFPISSLARFHTTRINEISPLRYVLEVEVGVRSTCPADKALSRMTPVGHTLEEVLKQVAQLS